MAQDNDNDIEKITESSPIEADNSIFNDASIGDEIGGVGPVDEIQSAENAVLSEENIEEAKTDNTELQEYVENNAQENIETFDDETENTQEMITVRPVKFQHFEITDPLRTVKKNLDIMQDISMHISVELGRAKSTIKEVLEMTQGSVVELNKIAGEQVEIYVNNKLVARGEVIVIEDKFGVRVTSTNLPKTE